MQHEGGVTQKQIYGRCNIQRMQTAADNRLSSEIQKSRTHFMKISATSVGLSKQSTNSGRNRPR